METAICPICGQEVEGAEGVDPEENMDFCDECQRYVCTDCYFHVDRMCEECYEKKEAVGDTV
jgi:hypothetical protein